MNPLTCPRSHCDRSRGSLLAWLQPLCSPIARLDSMQMSFDFGPDGLVHPMWVPGSGTIRVDLALGLEHGIVSVSDVASRPDADQQSVRMRNAAIAQRVITHSVRYPASHLALNEPLAPTGDKVGFGTVVRESRSEREAHSPASTSVVASGGRARRGSIARSGQDPPGPPPAPLVEERSSA